MSTAGEHRSRRKLAMGCRPKRSPWRADATLNAILIRDLLARAIERGKPDVRPARGGPHASIGRAHGVVGFRC